MHMDLSETAIPRHNGNIDRQHRTDDRRFYKKTKNLDLKLIKVKVFLILNFSEFSW